MDSRRRITWLQSWITPVSSWHYAEMNQLPVAFDLDAIRSFGVTPFFGDIIAEDDYVRHDPAALAQTVFQLYDRYGRTLERMRRQ